MAYGQKRKHLIINLKVAREEVNFEDIANEDMHFYSNLYKKEDVH